MKINGTNLDWGHPQAALEYVVVKTKVSFDSLSAIEINDGPAIRVSTKNGGSEVFVHRTYMAAAEQAVAFLLGKQLSPHKNTKLNRKARRRFDAKVRKKMS